MKKRLVAFFLTVAFVLSFTVFADYYPDDVIRADIPFSEMLGYEIDYEGTIKALQKTEKLIDSGAPIYEILDSLDGALPENTIDASTRHTLDNIMASVDNSAENNNRATASNNYALDIQQLTMKIIKKLAESRYRNQFIEYMGVTEAEITELIESMPTDEEYAIAKEINVLTEEYYNNVFGSYEMEYNGKKYTLETISAAPKTEYYDLMTKYFKESSEILSDIFIRITEKRCELAKAAGYDSYVEYAYAEEYPKDYVKEDRQSFYDYTAKYIVPLYNKLYDAVDSFAEPDEFDLTDEEITASVRVSLEAIDPELTEAFDYMMKYGLCHISSSDKKRPGAYTAALEYFRVPFIFQNPQDSQLEMYSTLVHEYGHFNAAFHSPELCDPEYAADAPMNIDVAEIHSQGLELLFLDDYGRVFGNSAVYHRYVCLLNLLDAVISAGVFSMWLEDVYTTAQSEKLTEEILCKSFADTCKALGVEDLYLYTGLNCEWIMVPHSFEVPFYYISYGVSAMAAMELFSDSQANRADAADRYMKLSSKGTTVPFKETVEECGFSDIFAESTFDSISDAVSAYTGIGYTDVKIDDWFYPYVITTANFMDSPLSDSFNPDLPATRLSFVEALGRMEDDINGIGTPRYSFSDTKSPYVSWAADEGIVAGISEKEFGAELPVTREQIICFLYRLAGEPEVDSSPEFSDRSDISLWAVDAVAWAQNSGVASGYTDNTFRPKNSVTRGEVAKFLADTYKTNY